MGDLNPIYNMVPWVHQDNISKDITISSAAFAAIKVTTNRLTDRATPSVATDRN